MKQFLVFFIGVFFIQTLAAQPLNNEWIVYNKTYYKFYTQQTQLHRISGATLQAWGLGNTPVEQFQLWRNGKQIPVFTSVATGILPATGYIEFWATAADGELDKELYRYSDYQLNPQTSLHTAFATYFLTTEVNTTLNLRYTNTVNDVVNNTLPAQASFTHQERINFQNQISKGEANTFYGEYIYSSSYDKGEGWSSEDITNANAITVTRNNLFPVVGGTATVEAAFIGTSVLGNGRTVQVAINGTNYINQGLNRFDARIFSGSVPSSILTGNTNIRLGITTTDANDRAVCSYVQLAYERQFNFGGATSFSFSLPAAANGNYLEISNINSGASTPVLYDVTNNRRYEAIAGAAGIWRFKLLPSATSRNLVVASQEAATTAAVTTAEQRNFINYALPANQGNYLIITNTALNGTANATEQYRAYRASTAGGGYNAKLYDVEQIIDQYAFGVKKHPLALRNFFRMVRTQYTVAPSFALLLGKGITYDDYRRNETATEADRLNLVPTFGWPASDNLLTATSLLNATPSIAIGRIAAINSDEVLLYLNKVKEYDLAQTNSLQTLANKAWMKTSVHVVGANNDNLDILLTSYQNTYSSIIRDTLFGGNTFNFNKTSTGPITPITNALMEQLFNSGISILNYFGHSSSTSLDYNISDPQQFNNQGKYPLFVVNGCNAGNFFSYDIGRFSTISSLAEKFVLARDRGAIGFLASTHFGVTSFLDLLNRGFYNSFTRARYNMPVGLSNTDAIGFTLGFSGDSLAIRLHAEQNTLHGDPAIKINAHTKPDFVVEDPQVIISPQVLSVADTRFTVKTYVHNIGKATGDSVLVAIRRQYPDGSFESLFNRRIRSIRYIDSIELQVPIVPSRDRGENKILVTIDGVNQYDEITKTNNSVTKTFFIFEDDISPAFPTTYQIVNTSTIRLTASTANPLAASRQYVCEVDTTTLFNSPIKRTFTQASAGGVVEFATTMAWQDSTVYYWRVAPAVTTGLPRWNNSSFVYMAGTNTGSNQSHFYQHLQSDRERITLDSGTRRWKFVDRQNFLQVTHSVFGTSGQEPSDFQVVINGRIMTQSACVGRSIIVNVYDPVSLRPYYNQAVPSTTPSGNFGGYLGSGMPCQYIGTNTNFEWNFQDTAGRRRIRDFLDWIPQGALVTVRLILDQPFNTNAWANIWQADEQVYGAGNTMYHRLKAAGFSDIDSFNRPRTFIFTYKKGDALFYTPQFKFSDGLFDKIIIGKNVNSPDSLGTITSPLFGRATAFKRVQWRGFSTEVNGDRPTVDIIGVQETGTEQVLRTLTLTEQDVDITGLVNTATYPFVKLRLTNRDSIHFTPYQLTQWRVLFDAAPEGALAGNVFLNIPDSVQLGQPFTAQIAFKNISATPFADSITVAASFTDRSNTTQTLPNVRIKRLLPGDTAMVRVPINTATLQGTNTLNIRVNPNRVLPEQSLTNNFLFKTFVVGGDNARPNLDVTFDGVRILNNDIVAAKPLIVAKLTDENRFMLLNDTSLVTVQVRYPNNSLRRFGFGTDTLRFIPAVQGTNNAATIEFSPAFLEDGDYILYVKGKDRSGNVSGSIDYSVSFKVINKPMITNVFNYPNPFTTSTAFVFTLTGAEVPQNLRIQILTITGKIVKEITKEELGPIQIGRNITEYKWDGTDMFGQPLGNGVYLYRVITNQNGRSLDKFATQDANGNVTNTDQYFKQGYGKMYLMR